MFLVLLDDFSNLGHTDLMVKKSDAFQCYLAVEARWERKSGNVVLNVRSDGAKEFIEGSFGAHLRAKGITHQIAAAYAHPQNGKAERYIRTLEETAQTLLADAGLPPEFYGDAVLTAQYLRNRLPTSTLPAITTPYEIMEQKKPDLSHLRVWGCQCFVLIPHEKRTKGGPKRFEAIFVGYENDRIGWRYRSTSGQYGFSRDIIFNENVRGSLRRARPATPAASTVPLTRPPSPRPHRLQVLTDRGRDWADAIRVRDERYQRLRARGHFAPTLHPQQSMVAIEDFLSLFALADLQESPDDLPSLEYPVLLEQTCLAAFPDPLRLPKSFDLSKAPENYREAIARPDADVWRAAMDREMSSLKERNVFKPTVLPPGRRAIGTRWVYAYKYHPDGSITRGKEKARLVAQGFSQRPEDYGDTYSPVAKMASIRVVLAFAAARDYEVVCYDVKSAFLNALLSHEVYCRQIEGFREKDPATVYLTLRAIYGLRQSSREFYTLLRRILESLGLMVCEVDKAVFYGRFKEPPHPSISMPNNGEDLVIFMPVHVDDGLVATNSLPLYEWILSEMNNHFEVNDLGAASLYLGIRITRDRPARKLWLSQRHFITDLLTTYNLLNAHPSPVPLRQKLCSLPDAPPNSLPEIPDDEVKIHYQRLVGSLLYLALCTRPDIAYATMALGQYNANPTRAHLLAAKGVLRYLLGTIDYGLEYNFTQAPVGPPASVIIPSDCAFTDADWASDERDRRSISGFAFFLFSALVAWSAVKQRTTALSSTEAEYMALVHVLREALWLRLFLTILGFPCPRPFPLLCDNQSALAIANSEAITSRSKHIDVRYHFYREHISSGSFATSWIPTQDMTADIFTKPLAPVLHNKHVQALGLVRLS
jgi:hypothetical protein